MRFKRLTKTAKPPEFKTPGAACFDLCLDTPPLAVIRPGETVLVGTGLAFEIPRQHVMQVFVRSSIGARDKVGLANDVGIIDSDYRGEVKLALQNRGMKEVAYVAGERIAQGTVLYLPTIMLREADNLEPTGRGTGGFGSTGI